MNYRNRYKKHADEVIEKKTPQLDFTGKVQFVEKTKPVNPLLKSKYAIYIPVFTSVAALGVILGVALWPKAYDRANTPGYYVNSPAERVGREAWSNNNSLEIYNHFVATYSPLVFASDEPFDARSFSPVDAFVNVALLGYISTGVSQEEILTALGVSSVSELNSVVKDVIDVLGSGAGYALNSFWYDGNVYELRDGSENILEILSSHYYANAIAQRPTTELVNEWLSIYVPQNRFPVIPQVELNEGGSDAAIVSSYFAKSEWANKELGTTFKEQYESQNHKMTFHGDTDTQVDYIGYGGRQIIMNYCQGVEMSLDKMTINFFLPDNENSVSGIFSQVVSGNYVTSGYVGATVPYFKIDNKLDLMPSLKNLGVHGVFDVVAASGLLNSDTSLVTNIDQFSTMSFDFGGLYSASVTVSQIYDTAAGDFNGYEPIIFNRPFVFTAEYNGAIILVGQVLNPKY